MDSPKACSKRALRHDWQGGQAHVVAVDGAHDGFDGCAHDIGIDAGAKFRARGCLHGGLDHRNGLGVRARAYGALLIAQNGHGQTQGVQGGFNGSVTRALEDLAVAFDFEGDRDVLCEAVVNQMV